MSAPVEVRINLDLRHLPGREQSAAAAEILHEIADGFAKNEYRPLVIHQGFLVGNVFLIDAEGQPVPPTRSLGDL